jgi:NADH-quinone oxidoreductase subunit L
VLSVVGGVVMLPGFVADFKPFERFLEPVFSSEFTRHVTHVPITHTTELTFSALAIAMAVAGWFIADLMYRREVLSPERFSALFNGDLYRLILNKYYIDELYQAVFVNPYLLVCSAAAWFDANIIDGVVNLAASLTVFGSWLSGLFDNYVVDGLVNLASNVTLDFGGRVRRLQTGSINGYLYAILAAVMLILLVRTMLRV